VYQGPTHHTIYTHIQAHTNRVNHLLSTTFWPAFSAQTWEHGLAPSKRAVTFEYSSFLKGCHVHTLTKSLNFNKIL